MKRLAMILFQCLLIFKAFSQGCPPNIDFEDGSFSNWECFVGTTESVSGVNKINLNPSQPVPGRHEIIAEGAATKYDPFGNFPELCPYGGKYSIKLGNENTGAEAEGLSYTFVIPAAIDTFTLTYYYAVVFQDPMHADYDQPRFFVTAYDVASGNVINCASYDYIAKSGIPGFQKSLTSGDVYFKDWSPVSIQFTGLASHEVRLEFRTADCTQGGHFGYAYVDVGTGCSNVLATAPYCVETGDVILNAPYGFKTYTWYSEDYGTVVGNDRTITLSPAPVSSGTFHVDMIPYPGFGCRDTADATIEPLSVPPVPEAVAENYYCQFATPAAVIATALPGHDLVWYTTETGGVGTGIAPVPPTNKVDTFIYWVSQKKLFGCESLRKKITVTIKVTPLTSFTINNPRQCSATNEFVFSSTTTNVYNSEFIWDFGDGLTGKDEPAVTHHYPSPGNYQVRLRVQNPPSCFSDQTISITVIPKPVADFELPAIICEGQTPVTLTDKSYVNESLDPITQWYWNVDKTIYTTKQPGKVVVNKAGNISVDFNVTSAAGCNSDTLKRIIKIRSRPVSSFAYTIPLCDNEPVAFKDRSYISGNPTGEWVDRWHWEYDFVTSSAIRNPVKTFTSGVHTSRLIAETNFGCQGDAKDTVFEVFRSPGIDLNINDSCILVPIRYTAVDLENTVVKWEWNFGAGYHEGGPVFKRTYTNEGDHPFSLMALTKEGCTDTIIREFTMYDNKASAGKDTVAAVDEPVLLMAHGGSQVTYNWSPPAGLSDAHSENPVAILNKDQQYQLDAISDKGCQAHSKVMVKRYKGPDIYIPNAFTPNGDGNNDVLKVFPVGIRTFITLSVYNRYGQLIYRSADFSKGWDGNFNGRPQQTGNFVAISKAIDFRGRTIERKENVLLIR